MSEDITVLEYLKFKLNPRNWGKEILPEVAEIPGAACGAADKADQAAGLVPLWQGLSQTFGRLGIERDGFLFVRMPVLCVLLSLVSALCAQCLLEPLIVKGVRNPLLAGLAYALSALLLVAGFVTARRGKADGRMGEAERVASCPFSMSVRATWAGASAIFAIGAFLLFSGNKFNEINLLFWLASIVAAVLAFRQDDADGGHSVHGEDAEQCECAENSAQGEDVGQGECAEYLEQGEDAGQNACAEYSAQDEDAEQRACAGQGTFVAERGRDAFGRGLLERLRSLFPVRLTLSAWSVLCVGVFLLCAFFRLSQLEQVPTDMFSDHAEKLYDVMDVLDGDYSIFFTRNTGREAFQFYWTALMIKIFGTGISFLSLKIGTALAGLFILPFVYRLGKMFGNRWVGLIAMLLCGVAYWPNVLSRVALRFAYYPMFAAPALYYLLRGLSRKNRYDLMWSGAFLGLGLQGYSAMRIVPFVFVLIFLIYLIALPSDQRRAACWLLVPLLVFSLLLALPLIRVFFSMPEAVFYRTLTRISETETAFARSPLLIFVENFWNALVMPFWNDGRVWVHSIAFRPALDCISAAFFFIGTILLGLRCWQQKRWQDFCLLLSIPLFMLPSMLSIAFPDENPSLNRTGAAIIPIAVVAAYGFMFVLRSVLAALDHRLLPALGAGMVFLGLLIGVCQMNYTLVFDQYRTEYERNALNTSQIGAVIRGFAESIGSYDRAYVIPYAHWVDTRLVGINAGVPRVDYALQQDDLFDFSPNDSNLLFIYKDGDEQTAAYLKDVIFKDGVASLHEGPVPGKGFYTFYVP